MCRYKSRYWETNYVDAFFKRVAHSDAMLQNCSTRATAVLEITEQFAKTLLSCWRAEQGKAEALRLIRIVVVILIESQKLSFIDCWCGRRTLNQFSQLTSSRLESSTHIAYPHTHLLCVL
jgi:hypothetical protein